MSTEKPPEITLPMIYMAVLDFRSDVIDRLERQRQDLSEGQSLLFQQTELHRAQIEELGVAIEEVRTTAESENEAQNAEIRRLRSSVHKIKNRLTPIYTRLDELERAGRRDTEILPGPPDG